MKRPARWLYVDATQGASGDMLLGALVDLGVPLAGLRRVLQTLPIRGWTIRSRRIVRAGLRLRKVDVGVKKHVHGRGLAEIESICRRGKLPDRVRRRALAVFRRLIEAEAEVHGVAVDEVHLHEAGGTDAIVDVVGTCLGLERLDVERIVVSPMTTGFGEVRCDHGVYPVPGPATARLVRGAPVRGGEIEAERLTPTGAALLTTIADEWGPPPPMRPLAEGYGAGARDLGSSPNALRMTLGTVDGTHATAEVVVLECNVDDATPQCVAHAMERLLEAGALDAFTTAVTMKKGRVGHQLTVLGRTDTAQRLVDLMLKETTTLGVRFRTELRVELERSVERVETRYGKVPVKIGARHERVLRVWPEYESCAALAARHDVSLWEVQRAALEAHARLRPRRPRR